MSGTLECEVDGRVLVLERTTKRSSAPMGQFSAWYQDTGVPVPGLTGETAGQTLLGVERDVFVRSAFIGQGSLSIDQTPDLERRIAALVSSGEDTSFTEASARLNTWKNRRKHNKTGRIPAAVADLEQVEQELQAAEQSRERMLQYQTTLDAATRSAEEVQEKLDRWAAFERQTEADKQRALRQALETAEAHFAECEEQIRRLPAPAQLRQGQEWSAALPAQKMALRRQKEKTGRLKEEIARRDAQAEGGLFEGKHPEEAWKQAQEAVSKCRALEEKAVFRPWLVALLCFVVFAAIGAVVVLSLQRASVLVGAALGLAALVVAALPIVLFLWYRKRTTALTERASICRIYQVEQPEEILDLAAAYREWQITTAQQKAQLQEELDDEMRFTAQVQQAEELLLQLTAGFVPDAETPEQAAAACDEGLERWSRLERAQSELEALRRQAAAWAAPEPPADAGLCRPQDRVDAPPVESKRQLEETLFRLQAEKTRCLEGIAMAKGEQGVGGDFESLQARRAALSAQRDFWEEEYRALELAQAALQEAHLEMQARFSPVLNQKASAWMARFTDGKYRDLRLDRAFSAQVHAEEDAISRPDLALSAGTLDQLYLAVRLAICELALEEGRMAPLVLDDALVRFDDVRLGKTLDALFEWGHGRQVLLLTCQGREATYLRGRPDVHILTDGDRLPTAFQA